MKRTRPEGGHAPRNRWLRALLKAISYVLAFGLLGWALARNRSAIHEVIARGPDAHFLFLAFLLSEVALTSTFVRWYVLARAQWLCDSLILQRQVRRLHLVQVVTGKGHKSFFCEFLLDFSLYEPNPLIEKQLRQANLFDLAL
jgi:hypothetical protein